MRLAVIPARWGSTRLPGKALADVGGLPMVAHVWRRVAVTGLFDRVVVATDDARIASAVPDAVLTGPAPSGTHRVAEVAARWGCELVVNVQGDVPEISAEVLRAAIGGLDRAPIATVAAPLGSDAASPHRVKVVRRRGLAVRFTRAPVRGALRHVGVYAFVPDALERAVAAPRTARARAEDLEQVAWQEAGMAIAVTRVARAPEGIDTPAQLEALRARFDAGKARVPPDPRPSVYAVSGLR